MSIIYISTDYRHMNCGDRTGRRVEDPIGAKFVVEAPFAVPHVSAIINNRIPLRDVREQNELPPFNDFGLVHLYLGGNSPFSRKFLYQNSAASTPCDLLANLRFSTCESIHVSSSGVTVTLILGLTSSRIYTKILPLSINIGATNYTFILLLCSIGVPKHDKNNSISASYGRSDEDVLHHGTGRDGRNIREGLRGVLRHRRESRHNGAAGHPAGCRRAHRTAAPPMEAMI